MLKSKRSRILALFLVLVCLSGWQGFNFYDRNSNYSETRFLFDTEVYVEAHGWGAPKAAQEALGVMAELDGKLDRFSTDSEISAINQQAGVRPVEVSDITFQVIAQSLEIAQKTGGAFDPAIGALTKVWGFGFSEETPQTIPSAGSVQNALKLVDYKKVLLDRNQRTVFLAEKGMSLDLGAIAKGYAVSKATEIVKERGISSALVSAGGNIFAIGKKPGNVPWHVGIRDPLNKEKVVGYVELENQAIDTSGDYERFFVAGGKKYSHILDPKTGYPPQGTSSCTVIIDNPTEADALSTAAFVMGGPNGLQLIEKENGCGLLISSDGKMVMSEKMKGKLKEE
jgi:thiamine biosynthesis lipoprotein